MNTKDTQENEQKKSPHFLKPTFQTKPTDEEKKEKEIDCVCCRSNSGNKV